MPADTSPSTAKDVPAAALDSNPPVATARNLRRTSSGKGKASASASSSQATTDGTVLTKDAPTKQPSVGTLAQAVRRVESSLDNAHANGIRLRSDIDHQQLATADRHKELAVQVQDLVTRLENSPGAANISSVITLLRSQVDETLSAQRAVQLQLADLRADLHVPAKHSISRAASPEPAAKRAHMSVSHSELDDDDDEALAARILATRDVATVGAAPQDALATLKAQLLDLQVKIAATEAHVVTDLADRSLERAIPAATSGRASSVVLGPVQWGATFKDDLEMLSLVLHRLPRAEDIRAPVQVYSRRSPNYRSFRFLTVADAERFLSAWDARPASLLPEAVARKDSPPSDAVPPAPSSVVAVAGTSSAADILAAMGRPVVMPRVPVGRGQGRRGDVRAAHQG